MFHFNPIEAVILLAIVVILFGGGRIAKVGGELGVAIREFRKGLGMDEKAKESDPKSTPTNQLSAKSEETTESPKDS